MDLKQTVREIIDYPQAGISFKDITTLLKDPEAFHEVVERITDYFQSKKITKVVALESRGFIIGGALAYCLGAGFVPVRKKGKLPGKTIQKTYELEYGSDTIEIHEDALSPDDIVLIHDDLLATGGTALASLDLVHKLGVKNVCFSFICDLKFIQNDQKKRLEEYEVQSLIDY